MARVASLKHCCLDVLTEGMRHADQHNMRTTFLQHLFASAEEANLDHWFITDLVQHLEYNPKTEHRTVVERVAALEAIEKFLAKHTAEELGQLEVRPYELSDPKHAAGGRSRMELMRRYELAPRDPASIFLALANSALTVQYQKKKAPTDSFGYRGEDHRVAIHAQFRAAACDLLLRMAEDAPEESRVANGAHEAAALEAIATHTLNKSWHRNIPERVAGVDLLERVNLPAAAAMLARIIDKESAAEPVLEAVTALRRLHPHDLTDGVLKKLVTTISQALDRINRSTHTVRQRRNDYGYSDDDESYDDYGEENGTDDEYWGDDYGYEVCHSKSGWLLAPSGASDARHLGWKFKDELSRREREKAKAKRERAAAKEQKKADAGAAKEAKSQAKADAKVDKVAAKEREKEAARAAKDDAATSREVGKVMESLLKQVERKAAAKPKQPATPKKKKDVADDATRSHEAGSVRDDPVAAAAVFGSPSSSSAAGGGPSGTSGGSSSRAETDARETVADILGRVQAHARKRRASSSAASSLKEASAAKKTKTSAAKQKQPAASAAPEEATATPTKKKRPSQKVPPPTPTPPAPPTPPTPSAASRKRKKGATAQERPEETSTDYAVASPSGMDVPRVVAAPDLEHAPVGHPLPSGAIVEVQQFATELADAHAAWEAQLQPGGKPFAGIRACGIAVKKFDRLLWHRARISADYDSVAGRYPTIAFEDGDEDGCDGILPQFVRVPSQ